MELKKVFPDFGRNIREVLTGENLKTFFPRGGQKSILSENQLFNRDTT
jgi:hypothetical protein